MSSKKKKAWSGRFTEPTHPLVEKLNASIGFDKRLFRQDIAGSVAHARMLGRQKIIPKKDSDAIIKGLKQIEKEISANKFEFSDSDEDIHMAIERRLIEKIGPVGGKLHTARSRNDQVATDFRLYIMEAIDETVLNLRKLQKALVKQAKKHVDTIAPSYTHLQPAQPVRLAHWFLAYYEMLDRDVARFLDAKKRCDVMPLGSAALAGTNFPIDRASVAKELGFSAISQNSLDAVSDRDFAAEYLFCSSLTGVHLSRLAEELIIFSSAEFDVIEIPDAFATGSSIMPQKKNPDVPELLRGKSGRFTGNLVNILTTLKGLPLAYNKDLQEDKEPVFDTKDQLALILPVTTDLIGAIKTDNKRLEKRAGENFMTAVDIADRLVLAGIPFREAHEIVGKLVRFCIKAGCKTEELKNDQLFAIDQRLTPKIAAITPEKSVDGKLSLGGTAKKMIEKRIKTIEREMKKWSA